MKKKLYMILLIILVTFYSPVVLAANPYCTVFKSTLQIVGYIVFIIRILVPLVIIGMGAIDLFKVVTAGKDGELPKAIKSIIMRLLSGIIIFYVPIIIEFAFSLVDDWVNGYENSYEECFTCVLNVTECK